MKHSRPVKVVDRKTGEEKIYDAPLEVAQALGYSYYSIMNWLAGRSKNEQYDIEYYW